jgi:alkyl hydroperoxide reductase subunit AhpC
LCCIFVVLRCRDIIVVCSSSMSPPQTTLENGLFCCFTRKYRIVLLLSGDCAHTYSLEMDRFDYTFVCPTEIISFSDRHQDFSEISAQVLAISTDSHHTHLSWTRSKREEGGVGRLNIPLVADISKRISDDYGVLVTDETDDMYGAALRGLFIIDPNGIVRSIQINDDAVGRSVEETLRILKAFQWADSHVGEACPASWTPGSDTIKTNPYESKEYFRTHYSD